MSCFRIALASARSASEVLYSLVWAIAVVPDKATAMQIAKKIGERLEVRRMCAFYCPTLTSFARKVVLPRFA
jgi:hypothetical protein